ncbi:MAG: carbamoyltransferase C-terminal domain-containing protein [Nitrospirota bacterium]
MMILAIHPGHNSTVALFENGKAMACLSQEKLDNIKNSAAFPKDAIEAIFKQNGLNSSDIDEIAISGKDVFPERCYAYLFERNNQIKHNMKVKIARSVEKSLIGQVFPWAFKGLRTAHYKALVAEGYRELENNLKAIGLGEKPRTHIEHHTCHARSAFHSLDNSYGQKPAMIFTMDGSGDGLCATVTKVMPGGVWERIAETPAEASLGGIYSNTTRFLGMKILEHEYKVMGLAPYCKEYFKEVYKQIYEPVINLDRDNPLVFKSTVDTSEFFNYLVLHAVGERFDNIAGAVQHLIEERVTAWIRAAIVKTGIRRIFTGGGVFMNVKLNKRIQEMEEVEEVFFMPSCGDESNPIGAAYAVAAEKGIQTQPLDNLYLGIWYSEQKIREFIDANKLDERYRVTKPDDIEETIAELIANRQIVARFSGKCEWGARSLGNRAILAHPSHMESFYTVNDLIKCRDFWMPFAPTILDTAADKYLVGYDSKKVEAPYMITAFQATDIGVKELRAALHQGDHTLRPQILTEKANPDYYRLLKAFEARTGVGAVLNTSFNLHGYPLVATPQQALMTFEKSGLKHLALGPFLISKVVAKL